MQIYAADNNLRCILFWRKRVYIYTSQFLRWGVNFTKDMKYLHRLGDISGKTFENE